MSQKSPIWCRAREQGRRRGRKEASSGCGSGSATSTFSQPSLWCLWWWSSSCWNYRSSRWSDCPDLSAPSQFWSRCHSTVRPCPSGDFPSARSAPRTPRCPRTGLVGSSLENWSPCATPWSFKKLCKLWLFKYSIYDISQIKGQKSKWWLLTTRKVLLE